MSTPRHSGCAQVAVSLALLLWLGVAPAGTTFVLDTLLDGMAPPSVISAAIFIATAALLLVPSVFVILVTRHRIEWKETAAVAVAFTVAVGALLLDAMVRAVFPTGSDPGLHGEGIWVALLRSCLLILYAAFSAWLVPRLSGVSRRSLWEWLGFKPFDLTALLTAFVAAALVTASWPVTGALGDSLTSLSLAFQALAVVIPQALIFWGVIFCLLTAAFDRSRWAGLIIAVLYSAYILGGVVPNADWGVFWSSIFLLPLALLLSELRTSKGGIYPLLLVSFCYRAVPLLFVDPRDALAQDGIPELQHVVSYTISILIAIVLSLVFAVRRRVMRAVRDRPLLPAWGSLIASALAALVAWCLWVGVFVFAGNPGFANDGFLIILEEQADLSAAYAIPDREARLQVVYGTLVETAVRTQTPLRRQLDELGVPYRPYYIINMIRVDGRRWLMRRFERQPGVAQVILNPDVRLYPHTIPLPGGMEGEPPGDVQANLAGIHADEAWALGVTGEGIVVGGQDTGYDWTHPALKSHYRGWDGQSADHDFNWHDAWDGAPVPFDDDSHGTHTMGTVLGDDGARNRTGVAPDARWIGCRNMRRGFGNPASYAECMEFFVAPYPHGGDPFTDGEVSLAPHVINNSWGCPHWEGCLSGTLEPAVEALRAAGIMMVVSVGNEGPACNTATMPPANYDAVFSIGATTNGGAIVNFSSRGAAGDLIKPDVTAPGESVRSSIPGPDYAYNPGTSMAAPHVTGLVALLWSADPTLIGDVDATEALICQTAVPRPVENVCTPADAVPEGSLASLFSDSVCACGDVTGVPNNVYGCGFIDAGAAVQAALGQ
jgi:subtilisin family serine protease